MNHSCRVLIVVLAITSLQAQPSQYPKTSVSSPSYLAPGLPMGCVGIDLSVCYPPASEPSPSPGFSYQDYNLGGTVQVLLPANHQYSSPSAFNVSGRYLHTLDLAGYSAIVDSATGGYVRAPGSGVPYPDPRWSSLDEDLMYFISPSVIYTYRVSTGKTAKYMDYGGRFTAMSSGGTGDLSGDDWMVFFSQPEHTICAVDLPKKADYCVDYLAPSPNNRVPVNAIDYALISKGVDSKSGLRYVVLLAAPSAAVFSVNVGLRRLDFVFKPELPDGSMVGRPGGNRDNVCDPGETCLETPHGDIFEDSDRQQYFIMSFGREDYSVSPPICDMTLSTIRLNAGLDMLRPESLGGGRRDVMVLAHCGGETWFSGHVGCARLKPYCVISTDSPTIAQNGTSPYWNELLVMKGNGVELRRIALHRSAVLSYWDQPRASISASGDRVAFSSNFNGLSGQWMSVAWTGFESTGQAEMISGLSLLPSSVAAEEKTRARITLRRPAGVGGLVVGVESSNSSVVSAPAAIFIPQGSTSATFEISTSRRFSGSKTSVTVTAHAMGIEKSANLQVTKRSR